MVKCCSVCRIKKLSTCEKRNDSYTKNKKEIKCITYFCRICKSLSLNPCEQCSELIKIPCECNSEMYICRDCNTKRGTYCNQCFKLNRFVCFTCSKRPVSLYYCVECLK